jgi:hypothetical protein
MRTLRAAQAVTEGGSDEVVSMEWDDSVLAAQRLRTTGLTEALPRLG